MTGSNCNLSIDYCASDPCDNGGTCINEENGFTCQCVGRLYWRELYYKH